MKIHISELVSERELEVTLICNKQCFRLQCTVLYSVDPSVRFILCTSSLYVLDV